MLIFQEILIIEMTIKVLYALMALFALYTGLRIMDRRAGRTWSETMDIIRKDPNATSMFYSARFIGACILIGCFILR